MKRKAIIEAKLNTILVAADSDTSGDYYSDSEHAGSTVGRISQSMQDGLTKITYVLGGERIHDNPRACYLEVKPSL